MKQEELQVIKDRYEKAASGPWEFRDDNEGTEYRPFWVVSENNADSGEWLAEIHVGSELDAEFIAHARQDVPDLIAEVERLQNIITSERKESLIKTYENIGVENAETKQLREALEFYADKENYQLNPIGHGYYSPYVMADGGNKARKALDGE